MAAGRLVRLGMPDGGSELRKEGEPLPTFEVRTERAASLSVPRVAAGCWLLAAGCAWEPAHVDRRGAWRALCAGMVQDHAERDKVLPDVLVPHGTPLRV